ncbi:MAG: hypothetical protein ACP5IM_02215 [Candidatus Bathyarchaeia archaeon]
MQNITRLLRKFKQAKKGISNVIVVMLSLILIVMVVSNVILWSYQMNQFDWEKMQEKAEITSVERVTHSPWFTSKDEFAVESGSRVNGSYIDTQTADGISETFIEENTTSCYNSSNPSNYTLDGDTAYVSGSTVSLQSDDSIYMDFRSYASAYSGYQTVTFDSANSTVLTSAASSMSWTHTIGTGEERLLLVSIGVFSTATLANVTNITYGSNTLTLVATDAYTTPPMVRSFLYCLVNPTPGTKTISVTFSASTLAVGGSTSYFNVNQTNPIQVSETMKGSGTTQSISLSPTGSYNKLLYASMMSYRTSTYSVSEGSGQTNRWSQTGQRWKGRGSDKTVTQGTATMSWTTSSTASWVAIGAVITPSMIPVEYTAEVEFAGTSSNPNWTKLTWTIDCSFTTDNVTTIFQIYNYTAGKYPTSGDVYGYMNDTIGTTDANNNQTITVNPTDFRNATTGEWKLKIKGVKTTSTPFDLKVDWVELKAELEDTYSLSIVGDFTLNTSTYPLPYINAIEIQLSCRASDTSENWFLKAYNWTSGEYNEIGLITPTDTTEFENYTVNLMDAWREYVSSNGTIKVKFCDANLDLEQTVMEIDFFGVRALINGTSLSIKNSGSLTLHVIAIWILKSTNHERYDANFFVDSGNEASYIRADIQLPEGGFIAKIVTERGNIAVFTP